jgi:hypothetical protein
MASIDNKHDVESASATKVTSGIDSTSSKSGDARHPPGVAEDTAQVLDHAAEKSLCWKFDIRLMPVLAVMCMC